MIVLGSGVINWGHKEHLGRGGRKSASAKIFVTNEHKCLLLLLPTCLDISYPTAYHFTFKPRAPPQKKKFEGMHFTVSAPGAENHRYPTRSRGGASI